MTSTHRALAAVGLLALAPAATAQKVWTLVPDRDNSIYEPPPGAGQSNGAFENIFSGNQSFGLARRALLHFDIAGNIPAGSIITKVELLLTVTQSPPAVPLHPFMLHRATTPWGEAGSNSGPPGGMGAPALPGDATWANPFEPGPPWGTPGGDFVAAPSATTMVGSFGQFVWTGPGLVGDVQGWLDGVFPNDGWFLLGDEVNPTTARRFGSREQADPVARPLLRITYSGPDGLAGGPFPSFCDSSDGALASCPCANAGLPDTGCDIQQLTGGVLLEVVRQETSPTNRATVRGTGYPTGASPGAVVIRADTLDSATPVVFGDGLRCIGTPLVRLGATAAVGGVSIHTFGHGAMAGAGARFYQIWFRNQPAMYCTPDAFNLSNGRVLIW
jgi:hypothetical protein